MGLALCPVAQYTVNNKTVTNGLQFHSDPTVDVPREADLKQVVQLGFSRGQSSRKSQRKRSRAASTTFENKTYMQIKMRSDGVVPFQNTKAEERTAAEKPFLKPLFLNGLNNFSTIAEGARRPAPFTSTATPRHRRDL